MRILTVSAFFESHGGGVEIVAGALARALARRGNDCRITGAGFDAAPQDEAVTAIALSMRDPLEPHLGLPMPLPGRKVRRRLHEEIAAVDSVVIHDALYATSVLAALIATKLGKPWVLVQHIGAIPYRSALLRGALHMANTLVTRHMLARAPQAFFISETVQRQFARVGYRREPALMFNGVNAALFRLPVADEAMTLRRSFGLAKDRLQLLFVGRFVEKKGLAALSALARQRADCDLLIVGSGPLDPAEWELPNARVLGRLDRDYLARLYRTVDALVLPSMGEGYPLVVQEAMASGLPVYCGMDSATADPDAAAFLHGIEVDPRDPIATANRLAAALERHPPVRNPAAAHYAASRYDWDANAARVEQALLEAAAGI